MRWDRRRRWLAGAAALALAVLSGLALGWFGQGHYDGRYALPTEHHEAPLAPATPIAPPPATPPVVAIAPPPPAPAPDADPLDDEDSDRIAGAISRATDKALERGEPVHWHKAGRDGYIVVSEAQETLGRVCRNVSATLIGDDGTETRSAAHLWCLDEDDGEWHPADRPAGL